MAQAGVVKGILGFSLLAGAMTLVAPAWATQSPTTTSSTGTSVVQRLTSKLLAEPLLAIGADKQETEALVRTLATYDQAEAPLERAPIDQYLSSYPNSPWRLSLLGNLGLAEAYAGRFTDAVAKNHLNCPRTFKRY